MIWILVITFFAGTPMEYTSQIEYESKQECLLEAYDISQEWHSNHVKAVCKPKGETVE